MSTYAKHTNNLNSSHKDWGLIGGGVLVALLGIVCFVWPGLPLITIVAIVGAALIVAGVFDIFTWIRAKRDGASSGWTLANGICSLILGVLFAIHPIIASGVIIALVGWLMIIYGIFALVSAFGLRTGGNLWGLMLTMGIVSVICGLMFLLAPEFFMFFLGALLLMRGITMTSYGFIAPNDLRF
jgi:uncharacterized membrane protein HdeD (DUF308 family)